MSSSTREIKTVPSQEHAEATVFHDIIDSFNRNKVLTTASIEGFLGGDKQAEYDFRFKIGSSLNQSILSEWVQQQPSPVHLKNPKDLSPREMTLLAYLYWYGIVIEQSFFQAFSLFLQATKQGDIVAQTNLGFCYYAGQGTKRDDQLGRSHLVQADGRGDRAATNTLGWIEADSKKAIIYFQKAADDLVSALYELGICYLEGRGVQQNNDTAFDLISSAAKKGCEVALAKLGEMYEQGIGVSKSSSRAALCFRVAEQNKFTTRRDDAKEIIKNRLLKLFENNPSDSCINYQALVMFHQDAKIKAKVQAHFQEAIPYASTTVKKLCSLPVTELEKMDTFDSDGIERVAITWNVLMSLTTFAEGAFTNIILDYLLHPQLTTSIKANEQAQKEVDKQNPIVSFFKNFEKRKALQQAREFKISYQRALLS